MREPVVTPMAPGFGVTDATLGIGGAVVVVVGLGLGLTLGLVVVVVGAVVVVTGGVADAWEPRASKCLVGAVVLAAANPPVATRARSAVAAMAAR
jgi:hypothetical protein